MLKKEGRNFNCSKCPKRIQTLRRCREDRWDFTDKDGAIWPMYVHKGGDLYGFCPGKATWDLETGEIYKLLVVAAQTGTMYYDGGIADQPYWFVDLLSWFVPRYESARFDSKVRSVMGDGTKKPGGAKNIGNNSGTAKRRNSR